MAGEKAPRAFSIEELPGHLVGEVLTSGRLAAADLARLEATCRALRPLAEFAASKLCAARTSFAAIGPAARAELLDRCGGSWKKVLRFLQSVEQSSDTVHTSSGNVATGLSFTVILTRIGQVYTCGSNTHGQLGHGDTIDRATPKMVELFEGSSQVVQVAAGASYTFAVTDDGTVHSFGSCSNFCLGHGDQHNELRPRAIQSFKRRNIHVVRVSAGDEHAVALDALGCVYTWGRGYCGALGHGDENDKTSPELISGLKGQVAVQVCARKRKTFVLTDEGSVFAFGWMGFGSLGFHDRGSSDKVMRPRVLESLRDHYVSQISTGLYHTVAVTDKGIVFGFGDNERAQLGQECIRGCLKPTEIPFQKSMEDIAIAAPSG
ncbi:hypothetical protein PR202_ga25365 [Eleusine coracana subsp. coracana]|uniref:RCC1-like domain-containing protein n=1 Tax=Eleusine coracana subsp. coracana TaxID=191504 RepID=A0AAV5DBQ4_ELECO|nr:hypothetical protein PR202_ga25365 [Eleusine coracana subsp. coracana]